MSDLAVFRCDGGPEIGTGHVMRCLSLARALATAGWRCLLAGQPGSFASLATPQPFGIELHEVGESPRALAGAAPEGCALAIVDHYRLDARYEAALRPWATRVLVIDDLADRPHSCDLLLDATLGRSAADYAPRLADGARLLLGPAYAPLRPEFAAARPAVLEWRLAEQGAGQGTEAAPRILIALGGLPKPEHLALVIAAVANAAPAAPLAVVAPSAAAEALDDRFPFVEWRHDVADMAGLMATSDLVVGAGGTSAWERCCLGLPSVLLEIADNQRLICRVLDSAGAALFAGRIDAPGTAERLGQAIARLAKRPAERREMARRAALVCDGLGALRVLAALTPEHGRDGAEVTLRPAIEQDGDAVLAWQAEPGARRHARDPRPPTPQEHAAWFARRLAEPRHGPFEIILEGGQPSGFVRLDRLPPNAELRRAAPAPDARPCYLLSILVVERAAGRGVGAAALRLVARLARGCTLYAEVLAGNDRSHALFRAAGYRPVAPGLYRLDIEATAQRV